MIDPRYLETFAQTLRLDQSVSTHKIGSLFSPFDSNTPIGQLHRKIAKLYGAELAFVSTNGTTGANILALHTLTTPGERVLVERDSHISITQALTAIGAEPIWVIPEFDTELGMNTGTDPAKVARALDQDPTISAAVFTSPKYCGVFGDIRNCIAACHERGVPVMVDEAHGDCLQFHSALPPSAASLGADIVTQSTHKWSHALAPGSVVLINGHELGIANQLRSRFLHALPGTGAISTSSSFPITASVEVALTDLARCGEELISRTLDLAENLRQRVRAMPPLKTWVCDQVTPARPEIKALNPLRVTVDVSLTGYTGFEAVDAMQETNMLTPLVAELGDLQNVLFLLTYGNDEEDVDLIVAHLQRLVDNPKIPSKVDAFTGTPPSTPPDLILSPRDAHWAAARGEIERLSIDRAIGKVSGETIAVYPPGNALIVAGERIEREAVRYLQSAVACGAQLKGASNPKFTSINIITNGRC